MSIRIIVADCRQALRSLPSESVNCCVTSPPYFGLRDYGVDGQIGLEPTPEDFVAEMVAVFREVRRVLRDDGTLWLNLGDSYAGSGRGGNPTEETSGLQGGQASQRASMVVRSRLIGSQLPAGFHEQARQAGNIGRAWVPPPSGLKQKDLIGIPWMVAFALRADGWYLRQDIIWAKPNPMPESVTDRCTKAHEYLFLLSKNARYHYDADAIVEALATDPSENYPARAKVTGRGGQGSADARGNDRDKSGGFPPRMVGANGPDRPSKGVPNDAQPRRGVPPRHADYASCDQSGLDAVGRGLGRNKRSVWNVATAPFKEAHFATFPPALIDPCILAGCPEGGTVLDPFGGAGTTGLVADRKRRNAILIELNPEYAAIARRRIECEAGMLSDVRTETLAASAASA